MPNPNPYYSAGDKLKTKNALAGGAAIDVPAFALSHVDLASVAYAADVGCGWGRFAVPLLERAPALDRLVCCDVWRGMVESCRSTLAAAGRSASFAVADARRLPVANRSLDLAMANHMLYEFDDPAVVGAELARTLRDSGRLLATTYSDAGRIPMQDLHFATVAEVWQPYPPPRPSPFSLENGRHVLDRAFTDVECHVLEETTEVDDPDAFLAVYLQTGGYDWVRRDESIPPDARARVPEVFRRRAADEITKEGALRTTTKWTTFVAGRPR